MASNGVYGAETSSVIAPSPTVLSPTVLEPWLEFESEIEPMPQIEPLMSEEAFQPEQQSAPEQGPPLGPGAQKSQQKPIRIAVFDLDNTIISEQTGVTFTRYLLDRGLVSLYTVARVIGWGAKYFVRLPVRQPAVREYIFSDLTELGPDNLEALAQDFHDQVLTTQYRSSALEEIVKRQREGFATVVASATFLPVAEKVAHYLRIDGAVGTVMEVDATDHFTGQVAGPVVEGTHKLAAIEAWANDAFGEGLWELAYAYGDHHSDIQTLAAATHPIAVNPCFSLTCTALARHWPIVHWS